MGALLPWGKKTESSAMVVQPEIPVQPIAVVPKQNDIVIHQGRNGDIIQIRSKNLVIEGQKTRVDPYQLIRMIKRVTQDIGEYKKRNDVYSVVIISALRKARGDLAGILESEFGVNFEIDDGTSTFWIGSK